MTESEKKPVDPFSSIDLASFKQTPVNVNHSDKKSVDKEAVKKTAEQSDFSSRQALPKKQKLVTKTFSLFQDEIFIIKNALKAYEESLSDELSSSSHSDAVRAGLHLLAEKTPEEQAELIALHRGRGRK